MFEILPNPSIETVMMVGRAALLLGAFWIFALAFSRWRRANERQMQHLAAQLQRTFAEVRSLHETLAVMGARLESLSERAESDARLAPTSAASSSRGYDLAARLAKNGAAVDELVASCGLTRHEAELLSRLHVTKTKESASTAWNMRAAAQEQPAPAQAGRKRGSLLSVVS
jgi:predicted RNase H-like nuclease (RuvC/YqgF family)